MDVINASGEKEPFSKRKVYRGVLNAGGTKEVAKKISEIIEKEAYPGITTLEISKKIKTLLWRFSRKSSIKFALKEGMRKLGPTGFPFERYVKEIFLALGYRMRINLKLKGASGALYEIDFFAQNKKSFIGECKYHHIRGKKVNLGTALESYGRFLDLKNSSFFKRKRNLLPMIVTNTKFTDQAIKVAKFFKISLLGWRYPPKNGLQEIIERYKLYPITILPSFNINFKGAFIKAGKMLAKDMLKIKIGWFSKKYHLPLKFLKKIKKEAEILLK